jgi:NAD-dependent histone deacetylase SIR2
MAEAVESGEVPHCQVPQCNGLVKPDIVFFGEQLPESFHKNRHVPAMADLIIVMGTSLTVQPFASLPQFAREGVPRVLFNLEPVGDFGSRPDDVIVLGDCDSGVRKLADALGWRDELEKLWLEVGGEVQEKEASRLREERKVMSKDELLEADIEKLTEEVDFALKLSKDHTQLVNSQLDKDSNKAQASSTPSISDPEVLDHSNQRARGDSSAASLKENTPVNTERVASSTPAKPPTVNTETILDITLPQNKPDDVPSEAKKPSSHI